MHVGHGRRHDEARRVEVLGGLLWHPSDTVMYGALDGVEGPGVEGVVMDAGVERWMDWSEARRAVRGGRRRHAAAAFDEGAADPAVAGAAGAGARAGVPRGERAAGAHLLQPRRALAVPRGRPPRRLRVSSPPAHGPWSAGAS